MILLVVLIKPEETMWNFKAKVTLFPQLQIQAYQFNQDMGCRRCSRPVFPKWNGEPERMVNVTLTDNGHIAITCHCGNIVMDMPRYHCLVEVLNYVGPIVNFGCAVQITLNFDRKQMGYEGVVMVIEPNA